MYQDMISKIDPTINAAGVEASMRMQYGTLGHLPRETFIAEIKLAAACEVEQPGFLADIAKSFGL